MAASSRLNSRTVLRGAVAALLVPFAAGCGGTSTDAGTAAKGGDGEASSTPTPTSKVTVHANVQRGAKGVKVDRVVRLRADDGVLRSVAVHTLKGQKVSGRLNPAKTWWTASERLEPGKKYVVQAVAADADGLAKSFRSTFGTQDLTLDQQAFANISPLAGSTVGVGMPVMIHFDRPVTNKKAFQKHMKVTSSSGQRGSFFWVDSQNVHYRPKNFWKPGSKISVAVDVNSVSAGNGIYGQMNRHASFTVARSMVSKVDMIRHTMKVYRNGALLRTIPITTGQQPKFTTRSGIKVITEKYRSKRMNSETIGIDPNSADGYDLDNVEYAMRITNSGEFVHAAPWSVGSQGYANVSHGCTGMSTSNAAWLYANSIPGDVVEYTGTSKPMTLTNGIGDWNESWKSWRAGSAL